MIIETLLIASALTALIFASVSLVLSAFALIKVVAMEKSTHQIYWKDPFAEKEIPSDEEMSQKLDSELEQAMKSQEGRDYQFKSPYEV